MNQGRSIRLFLVDRTLKGLQTAEIMNWAGHAPTSPRSKLTEWLPALCKNGSSKFTCVDHM